MMRSWVSRILVAHSGRSRLAWAARRRIPRHLQVLLNVHMAQRALDSPSTLPLNSSEFLQGSDITSHPRMAGSPSKVVGRKVRLCRNAPFRSPAI
jgi:hypothetical protein